MRRALGLVLTMVFVLHGSTSSVAYPVEPAEPVKRIQPRLTPAWAKIPFHAEVKQRSYTCWIPEGCLRP